MSLHLTYDELVSITGRTQYAAQLRWLRTNGFVAKARADGVPLVSRRHFESVMGGVDSKASAEPDYGALNG